MDMIEKNIVTCWLSTYKVHAAAVSRSHFKMIFPNKFFNAVNRYAHAKYCDGLFV